METTTPVMLHRDRHPARWLAVGLTVLLIGFLFLLSQRAVMPTQVWLAYFVAGLGAILVISGLVSSSGKRSQQRRAGVPQSKARAERPRKAKFSGQLGIDHGTLTGRKILFEFDPSMPYQTAVRDFVLECTSNREAVLVLTPEGSVVEHAVHGDENVKIISLTHDLMLSSILEDHQERPLNMVYDSLTDLALSADPRIAYKFALNALRQLSDPKVTAVFLLNPSAHEPKDVSSLRGLFSNQLVYGKDGISSIKFA
jgi:heme exporter protein D